MVGGDDSKKKGSLGGKVAKGALEAANFLLHAGTGNVDTWALQKQGEKNHRKVMAMMAENQRLQEQQSQQSLQEQQEQKRQDMEDENAALKAQLEALQSQVIQSTPPQNQNLMVS